MIRQRSLHMAILASILVVLGFSNPVYAQRGGFDPQQMRQRGLTDVDETIKSLALEGDKAAKVKEILVASVEKRFALMSEMRGQGAQPGGQRGGGMREAMTQLNADTEKQLAEHLTTAQLEKYRQIQEERRPRRRPSGD